MKTVSKVVMLTAIIAISLAVTVKSQELPIAEDQTSSTLTIEEEAVDLARLFEANAEEEAAAAAEEAITAALIEIKSCEQAAALEYAERIRCINSQTTLAAQEKREARECARIMLLQAIGQCHGEPPVVLCAKGPCFTK